GFGWVAALSAHRRAGPAERGRRTGEPVVQGPVPRGRRTVPEPVPGCRLVTDGVSRPLRPSRGVEHR
ncbi:MAG TPA: hypothetical protein VKB68_02315, partial [Stellaceae bacterium]|nr:hypothetical protein [Stellaceae bacterium]